MIKMFRNRSGKSHWGHLLACLCALTLTAIGCGGGGGGGSTPHLTYSGVSTQAAITETNAQTLADAALNAGSSGEALSGIAALTEVDSLADSPNRLLFMDFSQAIYSVMEEIDFLAATERDLTAAVETVSDSTPGSCGGSAAFSIKVDDVSGIFSGSMTFSNYCNDGVIINGGTSFSGQIIPDTAEFGTFTFSFDYVTSTSGSESITMDGSIGFTIAGSTLSTDMEMKIRDNNTNQVYMIENYQMDITEMGAYDEFEINGRFYHPEEGYVDIVTTMPFKIYYTDEYPSEGEMVITGEGNTHATLTAISNTQCRLEVDTDGDGTSDYGPDTIDWVNL